ncbi:MAG: ROK family transcriptional regulator [Oscillospiraceae bacterium]|nr:ROK family transcriptional regulator [Oscillospiraceae bacterium]
MKTLTHNADYIKEYNRKLILKLLVNDSLSRADLARKTGLTRATISVIADELLSKKLVYELPSIAIGKGRSPIPLVLDENAYYAIGVYLSRNGCSVSIVNIKGYALRVYVIDAVEVADVQKTLSLVVTYIRKILEEYHDQIDKILGVGLSCPGPIDIRSGRISTPPDFKAWHNREPARFIENETGLKTYIENNAYSLAKFEKCYGNARHIDDFLLLLIDTGVGSGIIFKGKLYAGSHGFSGEIGHTSINFAGKKCACGHSGCLEMYASIPNLLQAYGMPATNWSNVVLQARAGNKKANEILKTETDYLSHGIVNAVNFLNVEAVVLDGDILDAFDLIKIPLENDVNNTIIAKQYERIQIIPASGRENHHVAAAANILFDRFFTMGINGIKPTL